jgi:hypothetical protein
MFGQAKPYKVLCCSASEYELHEIAALCFHLLMGVKVLILDCIIMIIQVGSIIELRRSYQAYNVMPALSKVLKRYGA